MRALIVALCLLAIPVLADMAGIATVIDYPAANLLVKQHGDDVPVHAAMQADETLASSHPKQPPGLLSRPCLTPRN